jgi:hypothetical protein
MNSESTSKSSLELMKIAFPVIGCQTEINKITYKKYKDHHPEITDKMDFIQMMSIVNKKPKVF